MPESAQNLSPAKKPGGVGWQRSTKGATNVSMEKGQQWDEEGAVDAAMIEQYKAWWKQHGFPNVDLTYGSRVGVEGINEPRHQPTNEQWLWVAVLKEAIDDFNKTSVHWDKPCYDCHELHCSIPPKYPYNTHAGLRQCPHYHNQQRCAAIWMAGRDCEEVCNLLGIDVGYFRKKVGV